MIAESSSVAEILEDIILKIEIELKQKNLSSYANHSEFQTVTASDKETRLLSSDSVEDINCRICYDPNQELPVVYPCRCKVRNNEVYHI